MASPREVEALLFRFLESHCIGKRSRTETSVTVPLYNADPS